MLMIRLQRRGTHKKPVYRLVINEKAKTTQGNVLEILGSYNPHTKDLSAKADRINYWLSVGAQCSATVNNLLVTKKIIKGEKVLSWKPKKKSKEVLEKEKLAEEEKKQKAKAAAEAKAEELAKKEEEVSEEKKDEKAEKK